MTVIARGTKDLQCLKVIRWCFTIKTTFSPHQEVKMAAENVVLTPECVECHRVWQPSDRERWEAYLAYLSDDESPELAFYCPECAEREFGGS
jgi:Zn finger protein HypA/HybF involved in hydrogenase expression